LAKPDFAHLAMPFGDDHLAQFVARMIGSPAHENLRFACLGMCV